MATRRIVGEDGIDALRASFDLVTDIGKDVIRIAVAASSVEHGAFLNNNKKKKNKNNDDNSKIIKPRNIEQEQKIAASKGAILLTEELVDDGKPLLKNMQ